MIKQIQLFLGATRLWALFILLATTGLISLVLNAAPGDWVRPAQTLMAFVFVIGAAVIVGTRLSPQERLRWLAVLAPAIGALMLGLLALPQLLLPLAGAAVGWIIAGMFLFRRQIPKEYQQAIKHLRKGEYADAVKTMDGLIKDEPQNENYYRFRAEIFRVWGKLDRAKRDYLIMTEVAPESAVAFNGLAEVHMQSGEYQPALQAAEKAYQLAPGDWVAPYNLGMIEDRLGQSDRTIRHLREALNLRVPDARHRLLIHLYLARAYSRQNDFSAAQGEIEAIKKHRSGLKEWQTILKNEEAATLRAVLETDIQTAQALADDKLDAAGLS
jgi:tetratricopeptide (TPR) repeat protein